MRDSKPIRVMIVDDHDVVRSGLMAFLMAHGDLEIVAEASSGIEALTCCRRLQPDVVLMDLVMPGMDGPEATRALKAEFPQVQVIALTSFLEEELVYDVLQAGALSYLMKNAAPDDLAAAIRAAYHGRQLTAPLMTALTASS